LAAFTIASAAILDATEILTNFSDQDWKVMLIELESKSLFWKKRLIECLGDLHNQYELDIILNIINTTDEDLFITCVDSLRFLSLSNLSILKKEQIRSRIEALLQNTSLPVKCILEEFIKKNNL